MVVLFDVRLGEAVKEWVLPERTPCSRSVQTLPIELVLPRLPDSESCISPSNWVPEFWGAPAELKDDARSCSWTVAPAKLPVQSTVMFCALRLSTVTLIAWT